MLLPDLKNNHEGQWMLWNPPGANSVTVATSSAGLGQVPPLFPMVPRASWVPWPAWFVSCNSVCPLHGENQVWALLNLHYPTACMYIHTHHTAHAGVCTYMYICVYMYIHIYHTSWTRHKLERPVSPHSHRSCDMAVTRSQGDLQGPPRSNSWGSSCPEPIQLAGRRKGRTIASNTVSWSELLPIAKPREQRCHMTCQREAEQEPSPQRMGHW